MKGLLDVILESAPFLNVKSKILEGKRVCVGGIISSFKPYFLSALATLGRGVVWVVPLWESAERLYEGAYSFFPENTKDSLLPFPEDIVSDQDIFPNMRMSVLKALAEGKPLCVIATFRSLLSRVGDPHQLKKETVHLRVGDEISPEELVEYLDLLGYERNYQVEKRREYARRGGIVDVYPSTQDPIRIEFFGDEIESIRVFDIDSQVSKRKLREVLFYPAFEKDKESKFIDLMPKDWILVLDSKSVMRFSVMEEGMGEEEFAMYVGELSKDRPVIDLEVWGESDLTSWDVFFKVSPEESIGGNIEKLCSKVKIWKKKKERVFISTRHTDRLLEIFKQKDIWGVLTDPKEKLKKGYVMVVCDDLLGGFFYEDASLRVISDKEILGFLPRRQRILRFADRRKSISLGDLKEGDRVVHLSHGIGIFRGVVHLKVDGITRDFLSIEYRGGDRLFVPVDQMDLVQKYIGPEGKYPNLSKLGGGEWARTKGKVKKAAKEIAEELIRLYAQRENSAGYKYPPDTPWQMELEASFPYEETPDQKKAIEDVKKDLESPIPMDRLLCGDAGYGKTEVALRAAFKVVQEGKQVALLCPTTVLAAQHYSTFKSRLSPFPVKVEMLSRFRKPKEIKEILQKIKTKEVDIVIGTHRLLQKDVKFYDLGLLIIDEEQHFGVKDKEKLKKIKINVDVLTMTATPIPRTLHLSMAGIRDLSVITTPPQNRLPVKTYIHPYDPNLVKFAIVREIERGGQIYFVHNRVRDIERVAQDIRRLVPFAKVAVGHGQMDKDELELLMLDFNEGKFDVLVCTTIIESGLDIPNVNTIIVNNAHAFGLSQLYQLRGRVGRSYQQAYAYFLYPPHFSLSEEAQKRLEVIREFSYLGAGFQIALKDLEIRGAGNILGAEQSGHIASVGFELYTQMVKEAVEEIKGIEGDRKAEPPVVDLPVDSYIPKDYISSPHIRLEMYRKIADVRKMEEIPPLVDEFVDRFGEIPTPLSNMIELLKVKLLAWDIKAPYVKAVQDKVHILLPYVKRITLSQIQKIYEISGVSSQFSPPLLILEDLFKKPQKLLGVEPQREPPKVWIPKLQKILKTLLMWFK